MASEQVQMYQIAKAEQSTNKENVVLRALVGDPNRHKPLTHHPLPATTVSQEPIPASMYTLETRYRPIPSKVLPKQIGTSLYYIGSQKEGQPSELSAPITTQEPEVPKNTKEEHEPLPIVFLEPKIISQPVMYSIVGAKDVPIPNVQPIPVDEEKPSPILYTITGQPHRPAMNISSTTSNVATSIPDKSPIFYTLVSSPRLQVKIQEPIKQVSEKPKQHSPTLHTIVGNPTLIPHIPNTNTLDSSPLTQPEKVSSVQPVPILYTVVGDTQVPKNISKINRQPLPPIKKQANDVTMYTVVGDPIISQSMTISHKTQPLEPQKQQAQLPSLYPLVGKPNSLPEENKQTQLKPLVRKRSPPATIVPTRRISRSLDRQTAPESTTEGIITMPPLKHKRQPKLREPTIPKAETIFFPLSEHERKPRPKQPRTTPWYTSPERGQINHRNFQIPQHDPLRLGDYISPYAYHPAKAYRDQTVHPTTLPILTNNRSERKSRPPLYDPPYRGERKHPYDPWTPHSLERYPVKRKEHSRLWDFEDEAQTDDDEGRNGSDLSRKKHSYRRYRPRTPWIPVW